MRKFFPLLCALLCALPASAQEKDAPKEFGFNFGYEYSSKTRVTSVSLATQRNFAGTKPVIFEKTVTGQKGVIESETIFFLDDEGAVLNTLNSLFDESGHLASQTLTKGTEPPRALNWFKMGAQSISLDVDDSFLSARYTVKNGFLKERVLTLKLPSGTRTMKTLYDEMGRRERDITDRAASDSITTPVTIQFFYDQSGLTRALTPSGPDNKANEFTLERSADGRIAQMIAKEGGVLMMRSTLLPDEQGKSGGMKTENFEDGILAHVIVLNGEAKSAVEEEYEDGVLVSRKTQKLGEGGALQLISLEEFDPNGKLAQRTEYDKDGVATSVTTYNADGTVKSTQKFDEGK